MSVASFDLESRGAKAKNCRTGQEVYLMVGTPEKDVKKTLKYLNEGSDIE